MVNAIELTLDQISKCVTNATGISLAEMKSKGRKRELVDARRIFGVIARGEGFYYRLIAGYMNRDHSTAIHFCQSHEDLMRTNELYAIQYRKVYNCVYREIEYLREEVNVWLNRYLHHTHRNVSEVVEGIIAECIIEYCQSHHRVK